MPPSWLRSEGLAWTCCPRRAILVGAKASITSTSLVHSLGEAFRCLSSRDPQSCLWLWCIPLRDQPGWAGFRSSLPYLLVNLGAPGDHR